MVKGIDVSHYQPIVNWSQVALSCGFAIIKATEGIRTVDPYYDIHTINARKAGLIVGSYHFYHPELSPTMQAQLYVSATGGYKKGDIPPVVDVETLSARGAQAMLSDLLTFTKIIKAGCGVDPIIYTSPGVAITFGEFSPELALYRLWIAHYGVELPTIPQPWTEWTFWQNSQAGSVSGINHVDTDLFHGDIDVLRAYCGAA